MCVYGLACVSPVHYSTTIAEGRRRRRTSVRGPTELMYIRAPRPDAPGRDRRHPDATRPPSPPARTLPRRTRTTRVRTRARARRRRRRRGLVIRPRWRSARPALWAPLFYMETPLLRRAIRVRARSLATIIPPRARLASRTELKMPVCLCGWVWVGGCGGRRARLARQYVLGPPAKWRAAAHRLTRVPSAASRAAARAARHGCPSSRRTGASASRVRSGSRRGACRHRRRRRRCWAGRCPSSRR